MKIKRKARRLISICVFLILLSIILVTVIKLISPNNSIKSEDNDSTITGKNLKLPSSFDKYNLTILENDNIVEYSEKDPKYVLLKTQKNIQQIFDEYSTIYENPMSLDTNETKTIITGNENSVLKIIISKGEYKIIIENRK